MSIYATDCYSSGTGVSSFYISGSSSSITNLVYKSGTFTRNIQASSGIVNVAHGLGIIPKKITFNSIYKFSTDIYKSEGVFDSSGNKSLNYMINTTFVPSVDTTYAIVINTTNVNGYQRGLVTVDATNIIINWTGNDVGYNGNISIIFSAEGTL